MAEAIHNTPRESGLKHLFILLGMLALAVSGTAAESDWAKRIAALAPVNVTITEVEQNKDVVKITGQSKTNSDITALMRKIDGAHLGTPMLEMIQRRNNVSAFVIHVRAKR